MIMYMHDDDLSINHCGSFDSQLLSINSSYFSAGFRSLQILTAPNIEFTGGGGKSFESSSSIFFSAVSD